MKRLAVVVVMLCAGCRSAMTTTIENHGDPVDLAYLCGDQMFNTSLAPGGGVTWKPTANACTLDLSGPSAGRNITLKNTCHMSSCAVGVTFPKASGGASASLSGNGRIDVVGSVATVGP